MSGDYPSNRSIKADLRPGLRSGLRLEAKRHPASPWIAYACLEGDVGGLPSRRACPCQPFYRNIIKMSTSCTICLLTIPMLSEKAGRAEASEVAQRGQQCGRGGWERILRRGAWALPCAQLGVARLSTDDPALLASLGEDTAPPRGYGIPARGIAASLAARPRPTPSAGRPTEESSLHSQGGPPKKAPGVGLGEERGRRCASRRPISSIKVGGVTRSGHGAGPDLTRVRGRGQRRI